MSNTSIYVKAIAFFQKKTCKYVKLLGRSGIKHSRFFLIFFLLVCGYLTAFSQIDSVSCNSISPVPWKAPAFTKLSPAASTTTSVACIGGIGGCFVEDEANLVDASLTNYATISFGLSAGTTHRLRVTDTAAGRTYPAGIFAGFLIERSGVAQVSLFSAITIKTFLNGTRVDSITSSNLLSVNSSLLGANQYYVGLKTTQPFNAVEISIASGVFGGATLIYYPVLGDKFCQGPALVCNTQTIMGKPAYPMSVESTHTGATGLVCAGCTVTSPDLGIDSDAATATTLNLTAGVASAINYSVKENITTYPAGTFAGFDIQNDNLLKLGALDNVSLVTYLNGTRRDSVGTANGLLAVGTNLLATGGRQIVGFITSQTFNEIRLVLNSGLVNVNLGNTKVYSTVFQTFCPTTLSCNTSYSLRNPRFPVYVDGARTGVTGAACAACVVSNTNNVIDNDSTNFATLTARLNVASSVSIGVKDAKMTYPAGTFAGFTVRNVSNIIGLTLLNTLTISTYKGGVLQESKTGSNLLNLTLLVNIFGNTGNAKTNSGFVTTKSFDEIVITATPLAAADNSLEVYGAVIDTRTSIGGALSCRVLNPDFNVGIINVPVSGNVSTNDKISADVTYGTPVAGAGNPAGASCSVNADGSYTFLGTAAGVYTYSVPVCPAGQTCQQTQLTITLENPATTGNRPVVNPDIAMVGGSAAPVSTTINVRANDGPGNPGGTLGTPTVTVSPAHGTASVDGSGNIVYTPAANYYGPDSLVYQVCEPQGSGNCNTAVVMLNVTDAASLLTAGDDYLKATGTATATGNVLTNDKGAGTLTVTSAGTFTQAGKGTLTIGSNGSYSFMAVAGFTGSLDFIYTMKDTTVNTASATLHLEVTPFELNNDFNVVTNGQPLTGNLKTNDVVPAGAAYGTAVADGANPTTTLPVITAATGAYTFTENTPGVYRFTVPVCPPGQSVACPTSTLTITVNDPSSATNKPILNPDMATVAGNATTPAAATINILSNDKPGNTGGTLGTPVVSVQPAHGTATIDGSNNLVYTPAAGYYGTDVVTYQVCEPQGSGNCNTATVTVTVVTPDTRDMLAAADDYVKTIGTAAATGNVLTNDRGTGTLTVTTAGTTTISGKGTVIMNANGSYSFTPVSGFSGDVDIIYTVTDANNATATATLHVKVDPDVLYINVKLFLQGPYNTATGMMNNNAQIAGGAYTSCQLPVNDPYSLSGHYANICDANGPAGTVTDWVRVDLYIVTGETVSLKQSRALLLKPNGMVVDTSGNLPQFNFQAGVPRVVVRQRNHMSISSPDLPATYSGAVLTHDFTTALTQAYKVSPTAPQPMRQLAASVWGMWTGDLNFDGVINTSDYNLTNTQVLQGLFGSYFTGDINLDGVVNSTDLNITNASLLQGIYSPTITY